MPYGSKRENFAAIIPADGDDQDNDEEQVGQAIDEAVDGEMEDNSYEEIQADFVSYLDEDFVSSHPATEEINATGFRAYS